MTNEINKGMIIENLMDDYVETDGYEKIDLFNLETVKK